MMAVYYNEEDWWSSDDERDMEEAEHQEMLEMASECTCGAWKIVGNDVVHCADCVCGKGL